MDLARAYRPETFEEVQGQSHAVTILQRKAQDSNCPQAILLHGPTGAGKTTLARIFARELGCVGTNLIELNCADDRGIDMVRNIADTMVYKPMSGSSTVFLLDEVVQLPAITQKAFLKYLEEPPAHVYFLLCATDIQGLLPTFRTRCLYVTLNPLSDEALYTLINRVLENEKRSVDLPVIKEIIRQSEGSGRTALLLLETVLVSKEPARQLQLLAVPEDKQQVEFLAKLLLSPKQQWRDIATSIKQVEDRNLESVRRQILAYATACLLGGKESAYYLIRVFEDDWSRSGRAGLTAACWEVHTKVK